MEQGSDRPDRRAGGADLAEQREIDAVLAHASRPPLPEGAMARLMAKLEDMPQQPAAGARVVAFKAQGPAPQSRGWRFAAAVPLAASLALGVYLGARGSMDFMMPAAITGDVASGDDVQMDDLGGVGDVDADAQEGTT